MMILHVAITGADTAAGTESAPFRTINHAAQVALPGDTVLVHEGLYRDWVIRRALDEPRKHLGDVYLNGQSFYEALTKEELTAPARTEAVDGWTGRSRPVPDVEQTTHRWYAEVGLDSTTLWAAFGDADPNAAHSVVESSPTSAYHRCVVCSTSGTGLLRPVQPSTASVRAGAVSSSMLSAS